MNDNLNDPEMIKDKFDKKEFNKWFFDNWKKESGLITTMCAAHIIGISDSAVTQAVSKDKIKCITKGKTKLLSLQDVLIYKAQRDKDNG